MREAIISIEDALERILSLADSLDSESKPLVEALGQVLDEDLYAEFDIPPLANSAMDGYAVQAGDTQGARPHAPSELKVIGEAAAGCVTRHVVTAGTAVRIMTGAPIPGGADAVVPFEDTDEVRTGPAAPGTDSRERPGTVRIFRSAASGDNVRPAGEDVQAGELVQRRGAVLRPAEVGVIASLGRATVRVVRRPVVAVLSTGDELLQPGQPRSGAQIYDANGYSIAAAVARFGGVPRMLGIAPDSREELTARIHEALDADLVVTSAGVSKGDYDMVKDVLSQEGQIEFCSVAMKPGKPLAFGVFQKDGRRVPHLGLPGNPVSSLVAFELFGRAAIMRMMGKQDLSRPILRATATERIFNGDCQRVLLARCTVTDVCGKPYVHLAGEQGSGMLTSMMRANALTLLKPNELVEPGGEVRVLMLDHSRGEEWGSYRCSHALTEGEPA